jgi:hypothetical protein
MRLDLLCKLCDMDAGIDGEVLNPGASVQGR